MADADTGEVYALEAMTKLLPQRARSIEPKRLADFLAQERADLLDILTMENALPFIQWRRAETHPLTSRPVFRRADEYSSFQDRAVGRAAVSCGFWIAKVVSGWPR
jgi:hypothetical protein